MIRQKGRNLLEFKEDYVVFDLETTGLDPAEDEIIEISGIRVRGHRVEEEFSTLINPGIPIPYSAARINGITDKMVEKAPKAPEALERFLAFIDKDVLVGHNIHTFDTNFLYDGTMRYLGRGLENDYVDTLSMAKSCLPQLKRYRLTDLAAYFEISTEGAHRALNDCRMNQICYEKLGELWRQKEAQPQPDTFCCPRCGATLKLRKGKFGEFWGCTGFPQCRYTRKK